MWRRVISRIGLDKVTHFSVSAFLSLALCRFLPLWVAVIVVAVLGVTKEVIDAKTGGKMDKKDLVADALGVAVASILCLL